MSLGWIILAVVAAAAIYAILVYNRLVRLRNMVSEGFSGVDVQLRRRTDLVPNLVETGKAYAAHERSVLEEVTAARASSTAANDVPGQAVAARALQAALGKLFALAEAYPHLKADKNFLELQNQLAETSRFQACAIASHRARAPGSLVLSEANRQAAAFTRYPSESISHPIRQKTYPVMKRE